MSKLYIPYVACEYGLHHIDPRTLENNLVYGDKMTTQKVHWTELDDCHVGYHDRQISWNNCYLEERIKLTKRFKIDNGLTIYSHYNIEKDTGLWWDRKQISDTADSNINKAMWFLIPLSVIIFVTFAMLSPMGIGETIVGSIVVGIAGALASILGAGGLTAFAGIIAKKFYLRKIKKTEIDNQFETWVRGCRK